MQKSNRMLCLALGGLTALSLLTPVSALAAEAEAIPSVTEEIREQLLYNLKFYYLDREGKEVELESIRLTLDEGATEVPVTELMKHLPEGWVLQKEEAFPIPEGAVDLRVPVKKAQRELKIQYVTEDGKTVSTEILMIDRDKEKVVATDLREIPKGYTLLNHVDSPIGADTMTIEILVRKEQRELKVHYVTADGKLVHTETMTIPGDKNKIVGTDLKEIPKGYTLVNFVDKDLDAATASIDVLVQKDEPTEKVISVHYTTAAGKKILTVNMTVAADAKTVEAASLKGIPNGYRLVSKGSLTIDKDNAIHPVVEAEKKDENKDDVPKTGDPTAFLAGSAALSLGAGAVLTGIGRKRR